MELTNIISKNQLPSEVHQVLYGHLLLNLYPFAPHLTSEWFSDLFKESIHTLKMPVTYGCILDKVQSRMPFRI